MVYILLAVKFNLLGQKVEADGGQERAENQVRKTCFMFFFCILRAFRKKKQVSSSHLSFRHMFFLLIQDVGVYIYMCLFNILYIAMRYYAHFDFPKVSTGVTDVGIRNAAIFLANVRVVCWMGMSWFGWPNDEQMTSNYEQRL